MVYPGLCRSLRSRLNLRFSAGSLAVRVGRGRLVRGRHTPLGISSTPKVTHTLVSRQ